MGVGADRADERPDVAELPRLRLARPLVAFDRASCRECNPVERLVIRLKRCRRRATLYEKRAVHFFATVTMAAILLWL